jgi:hypothetical protein
MSAPFDAQAFAARNPELAELLAAQAKLYGQVTNAVWFARQIRAYERAGQQQRAEDTKACAKRNGVDWQAGMRELDSAPGVMRRRQACAA